MKQDQGLLNNIESKAEFVEIKNIITGIKNWKKKCFPIKNERQRKGNQNIS